MIKERRLQNQNSYRILRRIRRTFFFEKLPPKFRALSRAAIYGLHLCNIDGDEMIQMNMKQGCKGPAWYSS